MEEIQDLSKEIDLNNLTYHYKGKNDPKKFIGFKGPLSFYRSIKEGHITLVKQKNNKKEFKLDLNEILKGSKKSEKQKSVIDNIKTLYKSWEKVIELFDDCSRIVSEAKYRRKYGEGLKIITTKQMLQRLPIVLAHVKAEFKDEFNICII